MAEDKNKSKSPTSQAQQTQDEPKSGFSFFYMFILLMLAIIVVLSLNIKTIEQKIRPLIKPRHFTQPDNVVEQVEEEAAETDADDSTDETAHEDQAAELSESKPEVKIIEKLVEINKYDVNKLHKIVDKYRLLIANIARLRSDFIQHQDFSQALDYLEKNTSGCTELQDFLQELRNYSQKYAGQNSQYIKMGEGKLADFAQRFVKIEKLPANQKQQDLQHEDLKEKIDFFYNYVLSEKFMKKYIKL